jgi:hypothetical protein
MKKTKQRMHVALRSETRKSNGRQYHVLTWNPTPGKRVRKTFSDLEKAEGEADRIEDILSTGYADLSQISKRDLAALYALWKLVPEHISPAQLVQDWLSKNHIQQRAASTTTADATTAFLNSRSSIDSFSLRHIQTVRHHINRFSAYFGLFDLARIDHTHIKKYLDTEVGGAGKTRLGHLITIRSFFRWARDTGTGKEKFLPPGRTAADEVQTPKVEHAEHEVYTPEEFMRLLVHTPEEMIMFMVLGQFAGIRAEERTRVLWHHWREQEDGKLVLNRDVTKTGRRRRVDVLPNLASWLRPFRGDPHDRMVPLATPHAHTKRIAEAAGVPWKVNALRAGYCSYHVELFDNSALTAKNSGHSINELEVTYKSIKNVTKQSAREIFEITPQTVMAYAQEKRLPAPNWASKILEVAVA